MPRVHEDLGRRMIELRGPHRSHDGDVVDNLREMRQELRELGARLTVFLELERRGQELRRAFDEREALALDQLLGNVLSVVLGQRRLGFEEIELRAGAGEEGLANPAVSMSDARARPPIPNDVCSKKCRRVMARSEGGSMLALRLRMVFLLLRYLFSQISNTAP